ncbi:hypothetical protein CHS0354_001201, partial [Potamilus streckersoni]
RLVYSCLQQLKGIMEVTELINEDVEEKLAKDGDNVIDVECDCNNCVSGDNVTSDEITSDNDD